MNKFFRQTGVLIIILMISLTTTMPALAQNNAEDSAIEQKLELAGDFFATAIDTENFFAPFDDLFDQNACKRRDIFALMKKRDSIGTIIRKGILDPEVSVSEIREYQEQWELTSAEIYFVRNIEQLAAGETVQLASETRSLYPGNELIEAKVPAWIEFYNEKLEEYQRCQPTWGAIATKWKQIKKDLAEAGENIAQAWTDLTTEVGTTINSLEDLYDSVIATKDKLFAGEFGDFVKIDYGPLSSYLEETRENIRDTKIKLDAVENELERDRDASLLELTRRSVDKAGALEAEFTAELELTNERLAYNHADFVINKVWDEAQEMSQRMASLRELAGVSDETSVTYNLDLLNSLQCRERE